MNIFLFLWLSSYHWYLQLCPHTSEQNYAAERNNKCSHNLVVFTASVPTKLGKAVLMVAYLINRTIISGQSPFE